MALGTLRASNTAALDEVDDHDGVAMVGTAKGNGEEEEKVGGSRVLRIMPDVRLLVTRQLSG